MQKPQEKFVVFLTAFVFAFALWYSIKLGNRYTVTLSLPVVYTAVPEKIQFKKRPPEQLSATVNGRGEQLLLYWLKFHRDTAYIDMSERFVRKNVVTALLAEEVGKSLPHSVTLLTLQPDTLRFDFEEKKSRKVAVVSKMNIEPQPGFLLEGKVRFEPDSVTLLGLEEDLRKTESWATEDVDIKNVTGEHFANAPLKTATAFSVQPTHVTARYKTVRYTEGEQNVPIHIEGVPYLYSVRVLPRTVKVKYLTSFDRYENVRESDFRLTVRYSDLKEGTSFVAPFVAKAPPYIRGLRFEPPYLRYVITRR